MGRAKCPDCDGGWLQGNGKCSACHGTGRNARLNTESEACETCGGSGICQTCGGDGMYPLDSPSGPSLGDLLK